MPAHTGAVLPASCAPRGRRRHAPAARAVPPPPEIGARVLTPLPQMAALCGNVLELEDGRGLPVLAMSTRAYNAFTDEQKRVLR